MRTAPLTVAVLLISSVASRPAPYRPLSAESALERRIEFTAGVTKVKDIFKSVFSKKPTLESKTSLSSQDELSQMDHTRQTSIGDKLDDDELDAGPTPGRTAHVDPTTPAVQKTSVMSKVKEKLIDPNSEFRSHLRRHKGKYITGSVVGGIGIVSVPTSFKLACDHYHNKAKEEALEEDNAMRKCDDAADKGLPIPDLLERRDFDSMLEIRSPKWNWPWGGSSSKRNNNNNDDDKKKNNSSTTSDSKPRMSIGQKHKMAKAKRTKNDPYAKYCSDISDMERYQVRHDACRLAAYAA